MRWKIANGARSAELAIIISYPTSASGIIVLLKTSTKSCWISPTITNRKRQGTSAIHMSHVYQNCQSANGLAWTEVAEFTQWMSIHLEWASMIWIRSETVNIAGYQMRLLVWRVLPWVAEGFLAFGGNFPCRPKAEAARKTSGTERCFLPSPLTFERFYRITLTQCRQLLVFSANGYGK